MAPVKNSPPMGKNNSNNNNGSIHKNTLAACSAVFTETEEALYLPKT